MYNGKKEKGVVATMKGPFVSVRGLWQTFNSDRELLYINKHPSMQLK